MAVIVAALLMLAGVAARAQSPPAGFGEYKHTRWAGDDGAPTVIRDIVQTPDGYLWLASGSGLYRFDGVAFERIAALAGSAMEYASPSALLVDRAGSLWVAYAERGGVAVYRGGVLRDTHMPDPPTRLTDMLEMPDGAILAVVALAVRRMWRHAGGRWDMIDDRVGLPAGTLTGILALRDGTLLLPLAMRDAQRSGLLTVLPPGAAQVRRSPLPIGLFARLAQDGEGNVWVADSIGTRMLLDSGGRPADRPTTFPPVPGFRIANMAFDRSGGLWGTTSTVGIFHIPAAARQRDAAAARQRDAADGLRRFVASDGLTSDFSLAAFADREGNVWIGGAAGLDQFRPASVIAEPAIPMDPVEGHAIARAANGDVYFASAGTVFRAGPGEAPRPVLRFGANLDALCRADDGIWAVGRLRIVQVTATGHRELARPAGLETDYYRAQDRRGRLWVPLTDGSWAWHDGDGWHRFTLPGGGRARVAGLVATASGDVAMATAAGDILIASADRPSFARTFSPGIGEVTMIQPGRDDLFISGPQGFVRVRGERWQRIDGRRFPWLTRLKGLVQTDAGDTWLLGQDGISRIATTDLDRAFDDPAAPLARRLFDAQDGATGTVQHFTYFGAQAVAGADGRIWFLNRNGVVHIDPARVQRNGLAPAVLIRSLAAGDIVHRDPGDIALAAGTRAIDIAYTAPSLLVPRRVRFRYRLIGVDGDWVEAGTRRLASYANLGPGSYRFQVIAANDDGVWNEEGATLAFEIPPTFVESWPFRLLCALALLALLWLAYSLRLRSVAGRIRARMAVRLAERERIARELHDTLLQAVQSLTLRFQLAVDDLPRHAPARSGLEDAIDRADRVIAEGRDRVRDLRVLQDGGDVRTAIDEIVARQAFDPTVDLVVTESGRKRPLDPLVLDEVVRIAAEAVFNIWRHADATRVVIEIGYHAGFALSFTDDGAGIDPAIVERGGRQGHYGLPGMRERAARLEGDLTVRRGANGGTVALLTVPGAVAYQAGERWFSREARTS